MGTVSQRTDGKGSLAQGLRRVEDEETTDWLISFPTAAPLPLARVKYIQKLYGMGVGGRAR